MTYDVVERANTRYTKAQESREAKARRDELDARRNAPYDTPFLGLVQSNYARTQEREAALHDQDHRWSYFVAHVVVLIAVLLISWHLLSLLA